MTALRCIRCMNLCEGSEAESTTKLEQEWVKMRKAVQHLPRKRSYPELHRFSLNYRNFQIHTSKHKMSAESPPKYVYKIVPTEPTEPIPQEFPLSDLDKQDGFIHLSTGQQVYHCRADNTEAARRLTEAPRSPLLVIDSSQILPHSGYSSSSSINSLLLLNGRMNSLICMATLVERMSCPCRNMKSRRVSRGPTV